MTSHLVRCSKSHAAIFEDSLKIQEELAVNNVRKSLFNKTVNVSSNYHSSLKYPQLRLIIFHAFKVAAKTIPPVLTILTAVLAFSSSPAHAAKAAAATEHLHTGQKVANYFRTFGLSDLAILAIISAMPVVELRGAVPVGVWMGLPITQVLPICVLGNMCPIVPLMFLLRNEGLKYVICLYSVLLMQQPYHFELIGFLFLDH